jgi:hypothetical protein
LSFALCSVVKNKQTIKQKQVKQCIAIEGNGIEVKVLFCWCSWNWTGRQYGINKWRIALQGDKTYHSGYKDL